VRSPEPQSGAQTNVPSGAQPPVRPPTPVGYPTPEGGQPSAPGGHPPPPGSYPPQPGDHPAQPGAYPAQPGAYPAPPSGHPPQPGAYPAQPGAYPAQPGAYPAQPGGQAPPRPGQYASSAGAGHPQAPGAGAVYGGRPGGYPDDRADNVPDPRSSGHPDAKPSTYPGGEPSGFAAGRPNVHAGGQPGGYPGAASDGYEDGEPEYYAGGQPGGQPGDFSRGQQGDYAGGQGIPSAGPGDYPGGSGDYPRGHGAYGGGDGGYGGGDGGGWGAAQPGGPAAAGTGRLAGVGGAGPARTRTLWVSGLVVLVLAVAGVVFVARPGPVDGWLSAGPDASPTGRVTPEPTPPPVLAAVEGGGTAPTAAGVKAAIDPLILAKGLGTKVNVSVVDAATGDVLYERNPDSMSTPASTTKLLTAAAVLAARGPAYRLTTRAVAGSEPGEVVLVGGGDPTLAINSVGQFPGAARLDKLAAQVKQALGTTKPTRVLIDTSLYSGKSTAAGWDPSDISPGGQVAAIQSLMTNAGRITPVHHEVGADPRFADPALAAGRAFARQLGVSAAVTSRKAPTAGASAAPDVLAPGSQLGAVQSPPLVQVIDWMLQQSDNVIAEAMGRQVALAAGKPASFDGATDAIIAKLDELGLPGDEADLYDASGLSRRNGISPTLLTDVLALAAGGKQPALSSLFGGLPVAGWSGTLQTRFVTPSQNRVAQGIVRAKTGTLSGVNTMAGELTTKDGRLLVFAIMANGSGNAVTARAALDRVAAKLVSCGCG
jgi:D-alanyl-D-alanine carboxypeptidase/D-alanyl-D-alanine-endopeptidase (penicillin-binding protein 4)